MIVIIFQNQTNILVPLRIFESKDKTNEFIQNIESICSLYASKGESHES